MARKAYDEANIAAIAERIRANTGGTSTYKTAEMAGGVDEVYTAGYTAKDGEIAEQTDRLNNRMQGDTSETMRDEVYNEGKADGITEGRKAEYDAFWDTYQQNGNRTDYNSAFGGVGWTNDTFKPKYDITPSDAYMIFRMSKLSGDLVEILAENGVSIYWNKVLSALFAFSHSNFTRIGTIDLSNLTNNGNSAGANYLVQYSTKLKTIDRIILPSIGVKFGAAFDGCTALENLVLEGTLRDNFDVKSCPLTHDSLMSIINALGDGLSYTLTIGATNLAKLTEEEILIAENKGWTVK